MLFSESGLKMSLVRIIKTMQQENSKAIKNAAGSSCEQNKFQQVNRGFTLIETLIAITVAAILSVIAIPSMSESIQNSKVKELSSEFTAALHLTQSESIKRGIQVSMRTKLNASNEWQTGWDIFVDDDRDGIQDVGEELIQTYEIPDNGLTLVSKDSTFAPWLSFQPSGASRGSGGTSGGFRICRSDVDITKSRSITIQSSGNVIVEIGTLSCP